MEQFDRILERLGDLTDSFLLKVPEMVLAVVLLGVVWVVARVVQRRLFDAAAFSGLRASVRKLYARLISAFIIVAGLVAAAVIVFPDITPGRLFTMLGFGSIAIGFAFKDLFENLIAGFTILGRRTIEIGDFVEFDGVRGRVEEITYRDSYLRTVDGVLVVAPNAKMFRSAVHIVTDEPKRRECVSVGVAYGTDLDAACETIEKALAELPTVDGDHSVEALVREFGDSSIVIDVLWWTASGPLEVRRSRSEVQRAIQRALDEQRVEIPFPQRVLHLPQAPFREPARDDTEAEASAA